MSLIQELNLLQMEPFNLYLNKMFFLKMNFLAHVFLSGENLDLAIGNLIADQVKGKEIEFYPKGIQSGIILHRSIDKYTDTHPIVRECRKVLFSEYRHYSGVIVDMFFDHF